MPGIEFNISDLFKATFNIYAQIPIFFPGKHDDTEELLTLEGTLKHSDQTGIPMWDYFQFDLPAGEGVADTTVSVGSGYESFVMPDTTVCETEIYRKTVVTEMVKAKDVIEIIGDGLWSMTFRGFIINTESDTYPTDKKRSMQGAFKVGRAVKVISKLLNDMDIHDVVITGLRFPSMPGYANVQPFEMTAIEDVPIELVIKEAI